MNNRPRVNLKLELIDKILELLGWVSILGVWTFTLVNYFDLPDIIPIHYNSAGQVDGYGNKANILILPIVSTILFIGLTVLNKYPHVFNYPIEITDSNAWYQYTNATRMIRYLKLIIVIILGLIVFRTIQHINGDLNGLGTWFLPFVLVMIFIPILYFFVQAKRKIN